MYANLEMNAFDSLKTIFMSMSYSMLYRMGGLGLGKVIILI